MCLSVSPSVWDRIVQFWLQTSIYQHLITWFRWNLAHLSTLGCIWWYWCWNRCQQLFFMSRSSKIDVRGLLAKSLFSKKFWKFPGDEFWVLKVFCSSKTDQVTNFSSSIIQTFELSFCLLRSIMCHSGGSMVSFDTNIRKCQLLPTDFHLWNWLLLWCHLTYFRSCQLLPILFKLLFFYLSRSCRSLILFF